MAIELLPSAAEVSELFSGLLGKDVKVEVGPAPIPSEPLVVSTYTTNRGDIAAALIADVALAAGIAAGLAMLPKGVVEEAVRTGRLNETLLENYAEVANIASGLFRRVVYGRVALAEVQPPPARSAPGFLIDDLSRLSLAVTLPGLPRGKLTVVRMLHTAGD